MSILIATSTEPTVRPPLPLSDEPRWLVTARADEPPAIEIRRRPRMRWRRIGVWPLGAQVRRTGGADEAPDSSRKQIHAPRVSAPP